MFSLSRKLNGYYSWEIMNPDGSVAAKSREKNNLILNQGLDYLSVYYFANCFRYCAIGVGMSPPLLTDTGLLSEIKRVGVIHSATHFLSTNIFNIRASWDFSPETESVYYGEIGWSPESAPGNNLFSKTQMIDQNGNVGPLAVGRLQYLRVTYTLQITFTPASLTSYAPPISNWTTNGNASCQYLGLVGLDSTGANIFRDIARDAGEPSNNQIDIFISTDRTTPSGLGTGANYGVFSYPQRAVVFPYVSGSYMKNFYATYGRNSGVSGISSIGCGLTGFAATRPIYAHLMDSAQIKVADYELGVYFTTQWGRI